MKYSIKRKIIQFCFFGITNANLPGFINGTIYTGSLKHICVPGLNCYSCPGALGSCPLGSLQAVLGSYKFNFSFYIIGILLAFGVVFGRFICAFLCPFGLIQELIHKIPSPKIMMHKMLSYVKYVVLVVFVIAIPLLIVDFMGMGKPAFCQYICPSGTLLGGIPLLLTNPGLRDALGWLFTLKTVILVLVVVGSVFIYRFFCKLLCPLGAMYALFNRFSLYQLQVDKSRCVNCVACAKSCKMGVDPSKNPDALECIRCGDCVAACPVGALKSGFGFRLSKKTAEAEPAHECTSCNGCK